MTEDTHSHKAATAPVAHTATTKPTKAFFIKMLTRDIALDDALLDLLDNCFDGAVRSNFKKQDEVDVDKPYVGYVAKLSFSSAGFTIEDNCGGIPLQLAIDRAFRMGRPDGGAIDDADKGTVGVYGIGMKRALFKFGTGITVTSSNDYPFVVNISDDWMVSDDWSDFDLEPYAGADVKAGTKIEIKNLHPSVSDSFSDKEWVKSFTRYISEHYAILIDKGFSVEVKFEDEAAAEVKPMPMSLYLSDVKEGEQSIAPSYYTGAVSGVKLEIYAGLIDSPKSIEQADVDSENSIGELRAGWTVVCNDRVILIHDRTHLTGWGRTPIPAYHGQYSVIAGYVFLSSQDVAKLPLTTTKRGIDLNSAIYADVLSLMQGAIEPFIKFTNDWKTAGERATPMTGAIRANIAEIKRDYVSTLTLNSVRKVDGVQRSIPNLPKTKSERKNRRSAIVIEPDEGRLVTEYYGIEEDAPWTASLQKTWDEAVIRAKKATGK